MKRNRLEVRGGIGWAAPEEGVTRTGARGFMVSRDGRTLPDQQTALYHVVTYCQ